MISSYSFALTRIFSPPPYANSKLTYPYICKQQVARKHVIFIPSVSQPEGMTSVSVLLTKQRTRVVAKPHRRLAQH